MFLLIPINAYRENLMCAEKSIFHPTNLFVKWSDIFDYLYYHDLATMTFLADLSLAACSQVPISVMVSTLWVDFLPVYIQLIKRRRNTER